MKREYPNSPLVGVGAVVVHDDRVLLIKRGRSPMQGEWSIPGGKLELGETLRHAVRREVQEETNLQIEAGDLLGVFDRITADPSGEIAYHYVLVDFLCRVNAGALQAGSDAEAARWFTGEEISALQLPEDTLAVIRAGLDRVRKPSH